MDKILKRFFSYIEINTMSDPGSHYCPSSENQWELARFISKELKEIGLTDINIDENCYVTATLEANTDKNIPVIGFIAHLDTSPDFNADNVNPNIIYDYDGNDISLDKDSQTILSPTNFPELKNYIGQTIITTDGKTLLGADDKAGITAIISAMEYLIQNPEILHGKIRICFTPDEEIGRGADKFDVKGFNADWAYTIDGGEIGELEYENFNAAHVNINIFGKSLHPGYSFNKMLNASLIANEFICLLPENETPSKTINHEGFYHLTSVSGKVNKAELQYIIRDHDLEKFEARKKFIFKIANQLNEKYGEKTIAVEIIDQYFNMKEKILPVLHIVDLANEAMEIAGVKPKIEPIRGGTDGARLSYMGLPCPNIFAGGHNFHGPFEFVPLESIVKAKEVIVNICSLVEKKYK